MTVTLRKKINAAGKLTEHWQISIADFRHADGTLHPRIRENSPVNTRKGAEQRERAIRTSLAAGTYGKAAPTAVPTVAQFVDTFLIEAGNNNKPSTVDTKRTLINLHLIPAFGDRPLDQLNMGEIESFKAMLKGKASSTHVRQDGASKAAVKKRHGAGPKPLSLKSINNILAVLKRMLSLAAEREVIKHVPKVKLFKVEKPGFDFLDFDEADRLLAGADPEWRALILVALKTGLRKGELIGLHWDDVDLQRARLHVRRTLSKGRVGTPKGGRARMIDLPGSVVDALRAAKHLKRPYVFCQEDGAPLTEGKMRMPLRRALTRAGIAREIGKVDWHDLRHTYASHLAMRGIAIITIQKLMGHASIEMTMRYAHLAPAVLTNAVAQLDAPAPASASR